MYKKIGIVLIIFILLVVLYAINHMGDKTFGPNRVYIQHEKSSNKITVITNDTLRYIVDGFHSYVPDTNYVKVHINDDYSYGETLIVCWERDGKDWITIYSKHILENKLDPNRFIYNSSLKEALDSSEKFETLPNNCSSLDFYYNIFVHFGIDKGFNVHTKSPEIDIQRNWF